MVKYILDKKTPQKGLILLAIKRTDGKYVKVSMKIFINPDEWDIKNQRTYRDIELNVYLDTVYTMVREYLLKCRSRFCVIDEKLKAEIIKIITPNKDGMPPRKYDKGSYFQRFYEILPEYNNMKEAYEQVESEWNEAGVSFCGSFESFKVNKFRFLRGQRKHRIFLHDR
jgi:hypothetical protein